MSIVLGMGWRGLIPGIPGIPVTLYLIPKLHRLALQPERRTRNTVSPAFAKRGTQ